MERSLIAFVCGTGRDDSGRKVVKDLCDQSMIGRTWELFEIGRWKVAFYQESGFGEFGKDVMETKERTEKKINY